jgi:hypothetical protein
MSIVALIGYLNNKRTALLSSLRAHKLHLANR